MERSVTLSVHTASWLFQKGKKKTRMRLCALINMASERRPRVLSGYLSSTQADVEMVEIFGPFGGEARAVHQRAHRPQRREVKGEGGVARPVCEVTVAVAQTVVLSRKMKDTDQSGILKRLTRCMTHLVALAGRSAGFAGVRAGRGVGHQVRVGRTLCALAGAGVYVMAGGAGHARRAGGLAAESTRPATGGQAVHGVADRDGVDPSHVAEPLTELRGRKQRKTKKDSITPSKRHR